MAVIHVLDKHTAELIAAGEVVERPASVVKELLENAIDAGAAQITVTIESGGVKLIEISDNGSGIEAEYIPTAFIRHATSKIQTEDDLNHIHTLGFRGEALASIASVARVEVLTRTEADECASIYRIEGGDAAPIEPGARSVGTTIRVKDLFYNTPARMKFLKKDSSEGTFVADTVAHVALSHPEVSFKFVREGKLQYVTPGDGQLRSAAYAVLGREFSRDLIEVDNREGVYRVWGLITQPKSCRASRSMQYFYINGRYVRNRTMMAGMEMAFKGTTMQGKFPGGILLLEMPSDLVDVNVHPAKTEVRFARENDIFDLVYHATKLALAQPGTGERLFTFDEPKNGKNNEKSNNSINNDILTENTVKKNNFTGLSAIIPGQAEPGTLEHHHETAPATPAVASTPTRTSQPTPLVRPVAAESRPAAGNTSASAPAHTWTTVASSAPLNPDVSLHSPKQPEEEAPALESAPTFRAASSEAQLDIEMEGEEPAAQDHMAAWTPARSRKRRPKELPWKPIPLARHLPGRRSRWDSMSKKGRNPSAMWANCSRPISSPSGAMRSASLISTLPTSANFLRSWPPTTAMFPASFCWSRWWWSCRRRRRPPCWPTPICWKAQALRSTISAEARSSCVPFRRMWSRAARRTCWWSWPQNWPRAAAML